MFRIAAADIGEHGTLRGGRALRSLDAGGIEARWGLEHVEEGLRFAFILWDWSPKA